MKRSSQAPVCPLCSAEQTLRFAGTQQREFFRCAGCSLIFTDPASFPDSAQERERYAHHRDDINNETYRAYLLQLLRPLLERVSHGDVGLDYGCGPAKVVAELMSKSGSETSSFDPFFFNNPEVLQRKYDFIFCGEVVEHFHQPRMEFERLNSLLKPAGLLEIVTGNYREDMSFHDWWYIRDATHVGFYCEQTLSWLAERFGWKILTRNGDISLFKKGD
ncbi:class I SAM-dependent methyltransferase [bacterium]|nr:class I SAM-dependent methyltransferase [bacterium]